MFTVWLTGLPASGKSTIARLLEGKLKEKGFDVEVIDGDIIRKFISRGLGFSKEDRIENNIRIGYLAQVLNRHNVVCIVAAVSPYREGREGAKAIIGKERFFEVYVRCPVEVCEERDPKGLYKKARAGEIKNFTGVDDPYEEPEEADVVVETDKMGPAECAERIIEGLEKRGLVKAEGKVWRITGKERERVIERLRKLGYL